MKIMIDPGHGGTDSGAIGVDFKEKDYNLKIAKLVRDYLAEYNCSVYLTREGDNTLSLKDRVKMSNNLNVDIFISLHCNAHTNKMATGFETFSYKPNNELQNKIHNSVIKSISLKDRGKKTSNFYVLKYTTAKALLLELGFITNKDDSKYLKNSPERFALSIVNGIVEYGNLSRKSLNKLYKVQLGSFNDINNAKKLKSELESKGYNTTIVYS